MLNARIPWQRFYKYLGVTLDKNLHFREHIARVRKNALFYTARLGAMLGRKSKLSRRNKRMLYKTCIRTVMTYASPVFAHADSKVLYMLQVVQNKFCRAATDAHWCVRNSILHRDMELPTLTKYMKDASKRFFDTAGSHPNALLRAAVDYQPPPPTHFLRRPRNVLIDPPDALTVRPVARLWKRIERLEEKLNFEIIAPSTSAYYPGDPSNKLFTLDIAVLKGVALNSNLVEEITPTHKAFWNVTKALKSGYIPAPLLKRSDNSIALDNAEIVECLADSTESQYSHATPPHDILHIHRIEKEVRHKASFDDPDDLPPVSLSETQPLIKSLKTRRAPGLDGISNKSIKCFFLPLLGLLVLTRRIKHLRRNGEEALEGGGVALECITLHCTSKRVAVAKA
ncbi:RNA-directed DNA polymerase from mobile element jockey [Eumeta japonica]|uniref:RNA-directed DNA polymerase from mobile element jockey n=1 Tax=Eumeta variegata TaxID=151549 RepID=A0A4C1YMZ2_EUMVA|nr:RNA-directed DNA polymerase from mobile element jockey [Eumeta japonica]